MAMTTCLSFLLGGTVYREKKLLVREYSETCIKRTPRGNAVVSANTGCPPNTGFDR